MGQSPLSKVHPKTGAVLEPLYVSATGRAYWPIMGASPDDPSNAGGGASGTGEGGEGTGSEGSGSEGQGSEGGQGSGEGEGGQGGKTTYTADEYEALKNRMQAADRRASTAEQKIKEAEDAKKGDLEKAQDKVKEHETTISTLTSQNADLRLQIAFLTSNDVTWHEGEAALKFAQSNGYLDGVVQEDGTIDKASLKSALKKLATEKKYLVKSASDDGDGGSGNGSSGGNVGTGNKNGMKPEDEAALRRKFPALNL